MKITNVSLNLITNNFIAFPGGHGTFFGMLNTFVHIVMYSYYLLAALGPKVQPYLWWKKYLTAMQMVQFVLVMVHAFQLFFIDCDYPQAFNWFICGHAVMFYVLFRAFYKEAYTKGKKLPTEKESTRQNGTTDQSKNQKQNNVVYPNQYKVATGYISDNGLRNRVFISSAEE